GIGVDRNEQVGIVTAGNAHALAQRDIGVVIAGEIDLVSPPPLQLVAHAFDDIEHEILFVHAAGTAGAVVEAAMAGIQHDNALAARGLGLVAGGVGGLLFGGILA